MNELIIDKNEHDQRIDRFLKKYLSKASTGFIYKMLRKKRIKLNGGRANPEDIIREGDKVQLYLAQETIDSFRTDIKSVIASIDIDVIYEDENIALINKPKGVLSHGTGDNYEKNVVDQLVSYLYAKDEYNPRLEKTFTPSICNRLDRNTSGLIIGAKNYLALQGINESIRKGNVKKYYKCIVKGKIESDKELKGYLVKNEEKNKVYVSTRKKEGTKDIKTDIKVLANSNEFTLLEIDLITGRTHQIRAHLASIGHPIIGDIKYGDQATNQYFRQKYNLRNQYLHAYKIVIGGLDTPLDYLNGKKFIAEIDVNLKEIEKELF